VSAADRLQHPLLQQLYVYWDGRRAGRSMPARADIDPAEIKNLLPNLMIVEAIGAGEGRRFRYRLVGTALVEAFGVNYVGTFVGGTTSGAYRDLLIKVYGIAFDTGRPVFSRSRYHRVELAPRTVIRLLLPLSEDDRTVRQVMSLHLFDYDHGPHVPAPLEELGVTENVVEVL
jgi:hypothetical protein